MAEIGVGDKFQKVCLLCLNTAAVGAVRAGGSTEAQGLFAFARLGIGPQDAFCKG